MRFAIVLVASSIGLAAAPVWAQARVELVPSVALTSTYDNNLFASENASSDEMVLITPSLEAYYQSPTVMLQSQYSFDAQRAIGHPVLNALQAKRHGLFDTTLKPTPQFTFAFTGRYDLSQSPNELNFETGVLLGRRQSVRWQVTPSVSYRLRPRTEINAQYDITREALAQDISGEMQVIRLGMGRKQTPRVTWAITYLQRAFSNAAATIFPQSVFNGMNFTTIGGSLFDVVPVAAPQIVPASSQRSHALLAGVTWGVDPESSLSVQGGPRLSSYGSAMPEILATFAKRTRLAKIGLDYWQGESIVLGIRGPVQLQSSTGKVAWPVRRTVEIGAHAGVFHIETLQKAAARVFHGETVASWSPGGPYTLAASYGVDFQKGDVRSPLLSQKQVVRHVFLLRMTVAPRLSSSIKPPDPNDPKEVSR